jgi:S1-C subfamily serine protease
MKPIFGLAAFGLAATVGGLAMGQSALLQADGLPTLAPVLEQVSPAIVSIRVEPAPEPAAKNRREPKSSAKAAAKPEEIRAGSGVIFDGAQGLIITNNHVIEHADEITATFVHGRRQVATLVGADPETDLALLKVERTDLTAVPFSDSNRLRAGDFVVSVGVPFPLGRTVTLGIVSALHRSNIGIAPAEDFIQTDTAIYPGDSGGALVNLRGELVGINVGYIASSSTNSGVGFAIPSNLVRKVVDQLLEHGSVRRGTLGIAYGDPKPGAARGLNLAVARPVIEKVDAGSSAERAGLKVGDLVMSIDGIGVRNADELYSKMSLDWLGETVELAIMRDGQPLVVRAVMEDQSPAGARGAARK